MMNNHTYQFYATEKETYKGKETWRIVHVADGRYCAWYRGYPDHKRGAIKLYPITFIQQGDAPYDVHTVSLTEIGREI